VDLTVELLRRSGWTHGMPDSQLNEWAKVEADLCRAASLVFTASENTRRSMIDDYGLPELRVEAVGEGLCFDELPSPRTPKVWHQDVLFVGKGDFQRKGGEVLLAAFSRVRSRLPSARLTIVGPPPAEAREAVRWAGRVKDRATIRACYENASVFALPSLCEAFGLAFLEAMAFALPCIGTNRDAMPEIIEDGRTGFLVDPGDEVVLADRLVQLLEDRQMAARMGRAGYERVMSRFLWSHVAERMDRRLTQLLESQA
jgi:glycosyltransferase involved in cell wall biosynthesis